MNRTYVPGLFTHTGKEQGGAILNILSVASLYAFAPFGTYGVSKAAAMSLTQSLRYELHAQGTNVHALYAGFVATDMTAGIDSDMSSTEEIVNAGLRSLVKGALDIDADERAQIVRNLLRNEDSDTIQQNYFDRADEFLAM